MKIKVLNYSDAVRTIEALVIRNGEPVHTTFQVMPKAKATLSAERFFGLDSPNAAHALGFQILEQDGPLVPAPAAKPQQTATQDVAVESPVREVAETQERSDKQKGR